MTISETFMTRLTVLLTLCIVAVAVATTDLGWLGAVLFLAGYAFGQITPRGG